MKYQPRFHIVLHQPEIPPNTGAIGRTCLALKAKLWLVRPLGFQIDEKTLRRAGLDYWQHLEVEIADHWEDLKSRLPGKRFWYFSRFATKNYLSIDFAEEDCLIFGSETSGLPNKVIAGHDEYLLRIPVSEKVRSLNLASAVAVAGYEFSRQLGGLE